MRLRSMAAACIALFGSPLAAAAADEAGRYVLGPQDHLTIRVYDLRRNTGEAYSWTALNGQFVVAADGTVSMPLIGQIKAAGGTPLDLANAIGVALKQVADLAEKPAASVEVATYRPFYIIGVTDSRSRRDGRFIERVGFYNPVANEKEERVRVASDRLNHWIGVGAQVSDAVAKVLKSQKAAA